MIDGCGYMGTNGRLNGSGCRDGLVVTSWGHSVIGNNVKSQVEIAENFAKLINLK